LPDVPEEAWQCSVCTGPRTTARLGEGKGAFRNFMNAQDRVNPKEFSLPTRVKTYFEGVKSGADGEYEEVQPGPAKPAK